MKNKYHFRSRISERQFRDILKMFCADITALAAAELVGVNKNTTHQLYGRLRARVADLTVEQSRPFTGEVEIDESYFGARRVGGRRGRGAGGKIPVIGLLKRGGNVYVKIVPDCSREALHPIIKGQVLANSTVYTDGWSSYDGLVLDGYRHHRIHHQENQFARGKNHVNGIESFWSFAKLRMAQMRGLHKSHFLPHLLECQWRWNHRRDNLYRILLRNLSLHPLSQERPIFYSGCVTQKLVRQVISISRSISDGASQCLSGKITGATHRKIYYGPTDHALFALHRDGSFPTDVSKG